MKCKNCETISNGSIIKVDEHNKCIFCFRQVGGSLELNKMNQCCVDEISEIYARIQDALETCAWCDLENGRGKYLLKSDIISAINEIIK